MSQQTENALRALLADANRIAAAVMEANQGDYTGPLVSVAWATRFIHAALAQPAPDNSPDSLMVKREDRDGESWSRHPNASSGFDPRSGVQSPAPDSAEVSQEMALCEIERVYLKPDTLYIFRAMPGCCRCEELASHYRPLPTCTAREASK